MEEPPEGNNSLLGNIRLLEVNELRTKRLSERQKMAIAAFGYFLIEFGLFIATWLTGVVESNPDFTKTLSWMIENNETVRIMYIIWWSLFLCLRAVLMYFAFQTDHSSVDTEYSTLSEGKRTAHFVGLGFYVYFVGLQLLGLLALWLYPVGALGVPHSIFTGIAVIASIGISISAFVRRMCARERFFDGSKLAVVVFVGCVLIILALITLSIVFCIFRSGPLEFALALSIGVDLTFEIYDKWRDLQCPHVKTLNALVRPRVEFELKYTSKGDNEYKIHTESGVKRSS